MTLVKLTTSLAAVSPVITARAATRARRGSAVAAAAPSMPPERVGARIAQHGPFAQILGQHRQRGPDRRGGGQPARGRGEAERRSGGHRHLDRPAGAQVEQVGQVRAARDQARIDEQVQRGAVAAGPPASAAAASPVAPIPASFTVPLVTSPRASAPRWPRNPRRAPLPFRSS